MQTKAAVRIDFKVEIVGSVVERKEKLKTAVFVNGRERRRVLRADILFRRAQMNVEILVVVAELPPGADPRVFGESEEFMHAERATLHSEGEKNCWLEITLSEGKNREIRRMLAHLGYEVMRLMRIQFDKYTLGDLKPGEIREITP